MLAVRHPIHHLLARGRLTLWQAWPALLTALLGCANLNAQGSRFEPVDDRILVLAGQSVRATRDYYALLRTPRPAGYSDYISYDVGAPYKAFSPEAPRRYVGNDGLLVPTNWGAGLQCVACSLKDPAFSEAVLNIGMYLAGPQAEDGSMCTGREDCSIARLARGEFDAQLLVFARWLLSLGDRPVFLRVGYEFDGPWNGYDPEQYKAAWRYLVRFFAQRGVDNVAYVFHSFGFASRETLELYFPEADEHAERYVDWIGYSYFQLENQEVGSQELQFARDRGLRVFLGEVAPHTGDCARQIDLRSNGRLAERWMTEFFAHVERNSDVIRAIAYINEDWSDHVYAPQWQDARDQDCGGFFSRSNSRLNDNAELEQFWADHISTPMYLNAEAGLYLRLRR